MRLFVYGTLMDPRCVRRLTGCQFRARPATLHGWARTVGRHGYPVIDPARGARVEGLLLDDVDDGALRALDAYEDEGRLYRRQAVYVSVDGCPIACQAYVPPASQVA